MFQGFILVFLKTVLLDITLKYNKKTNNFENKYEFSCQNKNKETQLKFGTTFILSYEFAGILI